MTQLHHVCLHPVNDGGGSYLSIFQKLWIGPNVSEGAVDPRKLRKSVVAAIDELKTELETSHDNLAAQAPHHVLSSDTIMTHKFSTSQTLRVWHTIRAVVHSQ